MFRKNNHSDSHMCYLLYKDKMPLYAGVCDIQGFKRFEDARLNSEVVRVPLPFDVEIHLLFAPEIDCIRKQEFLIETLKPYANLHGIEIGENSKILCETDNEEFTTIKEAAEYCNASPSFLSRHLSEPEKYQSVKGKKFRRIRYANSLE